MNDKQVNDLLNKELATEATTSNIYRRLSGDNTCAIISPYVDSLTEEENAKRMPAFKNAVRALHLGFNQFDSRWVDSEGVQHKEQSLLIPNITEQQAIDLGNQYNQWSIIFKDKDSCRMIALDESGMPNKVVQTFNVTGNHILNIEEAKAIFLGSKLGAASMPIKGSNKKPFTLSSIEEFELYEVQQPRASYFQTIEMKKRIL